MDRDSDCLSTGPQWENYIWQHWIKKKVIVLLCEIMAVNSWCASSFDRFVSSKLKIKLGTIWMSKNCEFAYMSVIFGYYALWNSGFVFSSCSISLMWTFCVVLHCLGLFQMSLTIQQIILDAKRLAGRLKERETEADALLTETQTAYRQIHTMKQVRFGFTYNNRTLLTFAFIILTSFVKKTWLN